jgi:GT2 family glycosyltransferase
MPNVKRKSTPDLSIVIVSFNTKRITVDCISSIFESLQGSNLEVEVIVVDNNSSDGSIEEIKRLQKNHENIVFIESKENLGFGKANNLAVDKATAETVLLLNSDTVVLEKAVEKLYRFYTENHEKYPFVGAKLLNTDLTPQPSAGRFFTIPVVFGFLFLKGDTWGLTRSSPADIRNADWVSGACIITQKKIYQQLKGFDEGIFMYMEEVDLLYRAKLKGWNTGFYPDARFIHIGSASSGKTYPILQVYRGLTYFYKKHYGGISRFLLKIMLQLKALTAYIIGRISGNEYLIKTYEEAYSIAKMAR